MGLLFKTFVYLQTTAASRKRDDNGATATEYAILVAVIALVLILGASFFGSQLSVMFSKMGSKVSGWAAGI